MEEEIFWAKKNDQHGTFSYLPLKQHLRDTRFVMGRLWELWLDEGQKRVIEESLTGTNRDGKDLALFVAIIHDIGKCSPAFQIKPGYTSSKDLDRLLVERLEGGGFSDLSHLQLASIHESHHAKAGQALLHSYGVREDIAAIIGTHHGKPVDAQSTIDGQLAAYRKNYYQSEREDEAYRRWDGAQRELLNWALAINNYESVEDLPVVKQNAQVLLAGLLIMADWIASNEKYFPLIPIDETRVENEEERQVTGWDSWWKLNNWVPEEADIDTLYEERFGFTPRSAQRIFSQVIAETEDPGIFIFEAPMGMGKTEAALIGVEQLSEKAGKSGMFFGLPTQATSNGIFPRIYDWLEKIALASDEVRSIRLSHGKAALNEVYENIARNIDIENGAEAGLMVNEWFSGRKTTALDDFVVGTVDQLLMLGLKQKHLPLRHLGFSRKVIVIDEAHAYDFFMSEYLFSAVRWLASYNVPIIILSATLPAEKRRQLIESYLEGRDLYLDEVDLSLCNFDTDAYPLITYTDGDSVKQRSDFAEDDEPKEVQVIRSDRDNPADIVEELACHGGIIGVVVNTVKRAQETARRLAERFGEDRVELLHSSFIATDRAKKEQSLISEIGKDGDRPDFKIIVGTQVIEQSLDIDFDVMISDLAPMDLLLQRVGRLHRHQRQRSKFYQTPTLYVLGTSEMLDFEQGTKAVYDEYILTRTQYFLPDRINIPQDISPLVQKVYGEEDIELTEEIGEKFQEFKKSFEIFSSNKKMKAQHFKISDPVFYPSLFQSGSLIGWLNNSKESTTEEAIQAQVRDIQETIEVIALKKVGDGYGFFGSEEDLSHQITDFQTAKEVAKHTLRLPFIYSFSLDSTIRQLEEFNLKYLGEWQEVSWLKGSLGIIFDENSEFSLGKYKLIYSKKFGLTYEKGEKEVKYESV